MTTSRSNRGALLPHPDCSPTRNRWAPAAMTHPRQRTRRPSPRIPRSRCVAHAVIAARLHSCVCVCLMLWLCGFVCVGWGAAEAFVVVEGVESELQVRLLRVSLRSRAWRRGCVFLFACVRGVCACGVCVRICGAVHHVGETETDRERARSRVDYASCRAVAAYPVRRVWTRRL